MFWQSFDVLTIFLTFSKCYLLDRKLKTEIGERFDFIWFVTDSSFQTNNSKWLECESTRPSHNSTVTPLENILEDSDLTLTHRAIVTLLDLLLAKHDSATSLSSREKKLACCCYISVVESQVSFWEPFLQVSVSRRLQVLSRSLMVNDSITILLTFNTATIRLSKTFVFDCVFCLRSLQVKKLPTCGNNAKIS